MSRRLQLGLRSKTSTTTKTATARGRRLEDVACGRMLKRVGRGLWPKATGQQLWGSLRLQLAAGLRPPHPLSDGSSRSSSSMCISLASQNTIFQWSISAAKSTGRFRAADVCRNLSAPAAHRHCTTAAWPEQHAPCSGVIESTSRALSISARVCKLITFAPARAAGIAQN